MNNKQIIFSGVAIKAYDRDVQLKTGKEIKIQDLQIEIYNPATKAHEIYYATNWNQKIKVNVGDIGHFLCEFIFKRKTSNAAVLKSDGTPFVYGGFDFNFKALLDSDGLSRILNEVYKDWSPTKKEEIIKEDKPIKHLSEITLADIFNN